MTGFLGIRRPTGIIFQAGTGNEAFAMLKPSAISAFAALTLVIILSACGGDGDTPTVAASPTALPQATTATAIATATVPAIPTQVTPVDTVAPPATEQSDPEAQNTRQISDVPTTIGLPTVEVVKKLKPSVVQIVTEVAVMGP